MRRILVLFAFVTMLVGCSESGPTANNGVAPVIVITTENSQWYDSIGDLGEIGYTIENRREGLKLDAFSNVDWASVIEITEDVVTFVVAPNDSGGERRGTIELRYGEAKASVTIMQHVTIDVDFKATTTSGSIFTHCNNDSGVHSYFVVLSTDGVKEDGSFYGGSKYYCFDLCATEAVSKETPTATIPDGTYTLAVSGEMENRDINYMYSYYVRGGEEVAYSSAEVVVENGSIVANVALATGENHRVEYTGSLDIPVYSNTVTEGLSTLTNDHFFDIEDGVFVGAFVGDLMYNGCNTCQVYMYEYINPETGEERGDQFQIDLQLPANSRDVCGEYTHGTTAGHFIPGSAEDLGGQYMQQNSWYMTAGYTDFAPLSRGSVKVEKDASDLYIFTIDTVDDRGNIIRGVFRGRGEFIDW